MPEYRVTSASGVKFRFTAETAETRAIGGKPNVVFRDASGLERSFAEPKDWAEDTSVA